MLGIFDFLFGCKHPRKTFPQSPKGGHSRGVTYRVCLDCGKEFQYNWNKMSIDKGKRQENDGEAKLATR